ncbi:MAG: cytochrome P450 [Myxococcota bacterium]
MSLGATALESLDVIHPETYGADGYPHTAWARLRREDPVHRVEREGFDPFWAVTRHADVVAVSKRPDRFINAPRMAMMHNAVRPPEALRRGIEFKSRLRMLLTMDNPEHRAYRSLAKGWFSPNALRPWAARIEAIAARVLDELMERASEGECDFVTQVAARMPLKVIAEILGVPEQDEGLVLKLSNQGIGAQDPEFQVEGKTARETRREAMMELLQYFSALSEERRRSPRDDLATILANARLDGEHLPMLQLLAYFGLIAVAGHETTRNALSGGLATLMAQPEAWRRLQADPGVLRTGADEIARFTSPVIQFARTVTEDAEVGGKRMRRGDTLVLFYPSANRDEDVFEAPETLRLDRRPNPHLAFGIGEHFCLGANLAKLELRVMFRQLAERLEHLEPAGPPAYLASSFVGGIKHLPIRYRIRPRKGA